MEKTFIESNITENIFQNLGLWGGDGEPRTISCDTLLSELEVFIDSNSPEILNLSKIDLLLGNGDNIIVSDQILEARLSSNFYFDEDGSNDASLRLIEGNILHSKREIRPSLNIKFKAPLQVKTIKIYNRKGIYGSRSRYIAIDGFHKNTLIYSFRNVLDDLKKNLLAELNSVLLTYNKLFQLPKDKFSLASYVRAIVCDQIDAGEKVSDELLFALLPVSSPMPRLDRLSAIYFSRVLDKKFESKTRIPISVLKKFSAVLCDDASIDTLSHFSSKYISERKNEPVKVVFSKHVIHLDTLLSKQERLLDLLDKLVQALRSFGAIPIVAYGTLLGAYREGAFLPADDDLDIILYFPNSLTEEGRAQEKKKVFEFLKNYGFEPSYRDGLPHLTVRPQKTLPGIDIFPAWHDYTTGDISVVMQRNAYRSLSSSILLPPSEIKLYGRRYPSPAKIEAFLEERYGDGWVRPNPYYEWPWRIERRVYFNNKRLSAEYDLRESQRHRRIGKNRTQLIACSRPVLHDKRLPSNTIPMLLQAVEQGYDVVELKVRSAKNGDIILAHEDLIRNDDGEQIYLSKSSLDELLNFRLGNYDGENVFIASLDQALPYLEGKQVLLDARFSASDYANLRACIDRIGFDRSMLLLCVYNESQIAPLMRYFPESLWFWKFYRQAWEIDKLALSQIRQYGMDGIMYMYPHHDEDISDSLYEIKRHDLQSMCFIHGTSWTPPHSSGLSPNRETRSNDDYDLSLKKMVSMGIEYVTTTACKSHMFK